MNFNYYLFPYTKKNGTQLIRLKMGTSQKDVQYLASGVSVKKMQLLPNSGTYSVPIYSVNYLNNCI